MTEPTFFKDSTGRLRTAFRLVLFFVLFLGLQLVLQLIVGVGAAIYWMGVERMSPDQMVGKLEEPNTLLFLTIVVSLPQTLLAHGAVWICRRYLDQRDMASLGVRRPANGWLACLSLGLAAGMLPIALTVAILFGIGEYTSIQPGSATAINMLLVPTFLVMAYMEEIVCRGYLLQNFVDIRRPWLGMFVSNLIFWLMHSMNPHVWSSPVIALNLFFAGVLLSLAYLVSGNLWFPTAVHFGWNFCQGVVFGIPVSGIEIDGWLKLTERDDSRELLTGGAFGLEGSVVALTLIALSSGVLAVILFRNGPAAVPALPPAAARDEGFFLE